MAKRAHDWTFLYLSIAAFLGSCVTALYTEVIRPDLPYRVLEFDHHFEGDRLVIDAVIEKLECERLPVENDGFFIVVTRKGDVRRAEWRPEDGRSREENRGPGIASLSVSIDAPARFEGIEVWTTHACPNALSDDVRFVETRVGRIRGDVQS